MPEISLKAYYAKLDSLLKANAADEVIHHAQHFLDVYPRNVIAYRTLGRALVLNGRWDEGRSALRRVLAVYPDDYVAHLGLSEANEHLNRSEEAIFHLERAYEQNPNNKEVLDALRRLYQRYRGADGNLKIQLTAGAVARQNMRSGNYDQAIETLRSARARMDGRTDLKLLLAQVLWQQGKHEEAAEIAVEVLKLLPDCLEANRIMAKLWLTMGLPSEAQRYVNRLESVDPYLAVEVVQGTPPGDDVFRLDELDYVRTSQSELASARPDWLQDISSTPVPVEDSSSQGSDDWSSWTSSLLGGQTPAEPTPSEEPALSSRFSALRDDDDALPVPGRLTDLFGAVDEAPADELNALFGAPNSSNDDDSMAWLRNAAAQTPSAVDAGLEEPDFDSIFGSRTVPEMDANPTAWMDSIGVEQVDEGEPTLESLFAAEADQPMPEMDNNPMAWLEHSNSDYIIEEQRPAPSTPVSGPPPDWLQQDEPDTPSTAGTPAAQTVDAEHTDSYDWLQDDQLLDEALSLEGHLSGDRGAGQSSGFDFDASILDRQNEMLDQNEVPAGQLSGEEEPAVPGPRRGLTSILQEANFDWTKNEANEVASDDEMDEWLNQFGAQPRPAPTDAPDWLTDLGGESAQAEPSSPLAAEDDWFNGGDSERLTAVRMSGNAGDADAEADEDENADWLAEFAPEETTGVSDQPEWLPPVQPTVQPAGQSAGVKETEMDTGALPDWLTELGVEEEEPAATPSIPVQMPAQMPAQPTSEPSWAANTAMAEAGDESALSDWLNELESSGGHDDPDPVYEGDEDGEAEPAEEVDWLAELQPTASDAPAQTPASQAAGGAPEEDYPWMATEDADAGDPEALVDTGALPDWLNELQPGAQTDAEQLQTNAPAMASAEEDYTWMTSEDPDSAESGEAAEPVASGDMDWLSELQPAETEAAPASEPVPAATAEADYTWLQSSEDEAESEAVPAADAISAAEADDMDWLSELAPDGNVAEQEEAAATEDEPDAIVEPDWLSGITPAQPPAEPVAEADEDAWLSELAPEGVVAGAVDAVESAGQPAVEAEEEGWLSELEDASTPAGAAQANADVDEPDWLTELGVAAEHSDDAEAVAEPAPADDMDWLSELAPETEPAAEPTATSPEGDYTWMTTSESPVEDVEEAVDAAAAETEGADWLSELAPVTEESVALAEAAEASGEDDDLAWMVPDDVSEPEGEAEEEAAAEPVSTLPSWLADMQPQANASAEAEPVAETEGLGWPASDDVQDEDVADDSDVQGDAVAAALNGFEYSDEDEEAADEDDALEPTPANNAPDWLNAMVPGLDVDYEAPEEAWSEEDEPAFDGAEREYAWVEQMVEEEMAAVGVSGFSFSRPPAWMALSGKTRDDDDHLPDWVSDENDADVADSLR